MRSTPSSAGLGFAPPRQADEFSLVLEEGDTPGPPSSTRRVLLRRPLRDQDQPDSPSAAVKSGKSALLAHRISPGKSIQLKSSHATATLPEHNDLMDVAQPESVAMVGAKGPRCGSTGELLSYSMLGSPVEYEAMGSAVHGLPPPSGDPGGAFAPGASGAPAHAKLDQMLEREARQMTKLDRHAQQTQGRIMRAQESALRRYQARTDDWERQAVHLSARVGIDPSKLLMGQARRSPSPSLALVGLPYAHPCMATHALPSPRLSAHTLAHTPVVDGTGAARQLPRPHSGSPPPPPHSGSPPPHRRSSTTTAPRWRRWR